MKNMGVVWQYFKPFARGIIGIATILGGCFTAGWGGAWGLQKIFDTQLARAEFRIDQKLINSETKMIALHNSGIDKLGAKLDILIDLNKILMRNDQKSIRQSQEAPR